MNNIILSVGFNNKLPKRQLLSFLNMPITGTRNISIPSLDLKLDLNIFQKGRRKRRGFYVLFSDAPVGDEGIADSFERKRITNEITRTIEESTGQMNFLITGEWGVGKTSILKLIENKSREAGLKSLWFSPWKYSGTKQESNAISRAFLTDLAKHLGKPHIVRDLYIDKKIESERNLITQIITLIQLIARYIIYLMIIFTALSIVGPFLFYQIPLLQEIVEKFGMLKVLGVTSTLLALPPLGQYFVSKIKEQGESQQVSSPELFEAMFRSLVEKSVKYKCLQKLLSFWEETFSKTWLSFLGEPLTNFFYKISSLRLNKFIVFVDDLDRCETRKEAREFLSGMKTFFELKQVYYVIAADKNKLGDNNFLRKIIQIDWNVPLLRKVEIKKYTNSLLREAGALKNFNKRELEQVYTILSLQPNPRKIKYYLRRLLFELNIEKAKII